MAKGKQKEMFDRDVNPPTETDEIKDKGKRKRLEKLLTDRVNYDQMIQGLQKEKDEATLQIQELLLDLNLSKVKHGDVRATMYDQRRRTLNKMKLLDNGVSADLIEMSYDETTYTTLRVSVVPAEGGEEG